ARQHRGRDRARRGGGRAARARRKPRTGRRGARHQPDDALAKDDAPRDFLKAPRCIAAGMKTELFDYALPEECIAVRPPAARDGARMLVLDGPRLEHWKITDLPELLPERALVVVNATRVRRARLFGERQPGGGRVELLFLEPVPHVPVRQGVERWRALGRANRPLTPGTQIDAAGLAVEVVARTAD